MTFFTDVLAKFRVVVVWGVTSPTRENTVNSHLKSTPPDLLLADPLLISVTLRHQDDDSGLRQRRRTASSSSSVITKRDHAFQPRPAVRKQHVRRRRRGAHRRYALAEFRALQPVVRELGLQLHQSRGQVQCASTAESEEASERLHHLDQRRAQAAGSAQPRPGKHRSEQNTR